MTESAADRGSRADAGLTALAHAKLNLRHRVFSRDATGFHAVETILVRTDLADELTLEDADEGIVIDVHGPTAEGVPTDEANLCWMAAERFLHRAFPKASKRPGVRITLDKRVPHGGGLGGGSADAGTLLRLLVRRWPKLEVRDVIEIAGDIGSDVPFAALAVPMALGWERGRRLLPLRPPRARPGLLVCPDVHVSTPEAYGWLSESDREPATASVLPGASRLSTWSSLERLVRNDFESVVFDRHPDLGRLLEAVRELAPRVAGMSGSGSTLFALFEDDARRSEAMEGLARRLGDGLPAARLHEVRVPI